jgi:hypothetical protein
MQFERRCDYCSGGSLLIRKSVWDDLGGFDHAYYPAYFEDVDFCLRAAEQGWETWYQPRAVVRHARFTSTEANLRHYLWERAHDTFVDRWSRVLETREPTGAVELAVWKAMGGPIRVLVIGDQLPDQPPDAEGESDIGPTFDMLTTLAREPDIHVTFFPAPLGSRTEHGGSAHDFPLCRVRMIADLEAHLASDGVDFDVVVASQPRSGDTVRAILDKYVPHARLIDYTKARGRRSFSLPDAVRQPQPASTRD